MPVFDIARKEVHEHNFSVRADTLEEAMDILDDNDGDGDVVTDNGCEYAYTMDKENWTVRDEKGNYLQ